MYQRVGNIYKPVISFTIPLNPVTKKNHSQIITTGGKPRLVPSKAYQQYVRDAGYFIKHRGENINFPVNVQAIYYMQTKRKVDLINLHSALHDLLVEYDVVEDDESNIIVSTDGSRVRYDKVNPRTEIIITKALEEVG